VLWRWAGGNNENEGKSEEQICAEETARSTATVREAVLWYLRRGLEGAVGVQRGLVEKRIERVREKEKSVLYKVAGKTAGQTSGRKGSVSGPGRAKFGGGGMDFEAPDAHVLSQSDTARIEAELSPEQLQLFAEENDSMLRHYEDTLGKVQYVPLSLFLWGVCFGLGNRLMIAGMRRNHCWRFRRCRKLSLRILLRRRSIFSSLLRMWIRRRRMSGREIGS
jgi:hypothetical protein